MSTELVLLLTVTIFIIAGAFSKPAETFRSAGPRLGARLEMEIETAPGFFEKAQNVRPEPLFWDKP